MVIDIEMDELIIDTFRKVYTEIVNCDISRAILNGGRSSTKSQVAANAIINGVMCNKESAIAIVKYGNKIEERLVNTFREAIRFMGVGDYWKLRKSPFEYVLLDDRGKETDVSIKFTGCDNPENLKSFKPRRGAFRYIWVEELNNFLSLKEINSLIQTFSRGKGKHCTIMTYNPPMQNSNWVNKEYNSYSGKILESDSNAVYEEFEFEVNGVKKIMKQVVHHSSYLDVIEGCTIYEKVNGVKTGRKIKVSRADWLGDEFIGTAEQSKVENLKYYEWAYLGKVVGTDANVFPNVKDWDGKKERLNITEINRGFDWGYGGPDPCAYVEWYYDKKNRKLYALAEFGKPKMDIEDIAFEIRKINKNNFSVKADNASPILNKQLKKVNLNIVGVKKKPDSVRGGIKWLQSLNGIYISKTLTPQIYKEFTEYEYIVDKKTDEVTAELPDKNNHFIDATRYALVDVITYDAA